MNLQTPKQACEFLKFTRTALHLARKRGTLVHAVQLPNGYFLYEQKDLERFDSDRKQQKLRKERRRAEKHKISEKDLLSGRNSGIVNYHGIVNEWERWLSKVGGTRGMAEWPTEVLEDWLLDVEPIDETIKAVKNELFYRSSLVPICTKRNPQKDPKTAKLKNTQDLE